MRTGGYEQNRDDFYQTGVAKAYRFSKTRSTTMPMPSMPS